MELKFDLIPSKYFLKQIKKFSILEKSLVSKKLLMIKDNPFRFKSLKGYKHFFEVKIDISNQFSRLIYAVYIPQKDKIRIFGIFDRGQNFKDFSNFFKNELKKK